MRSAFEKTSSVSVMIFSGEYDLMSIGQLRAAMDSLAQTPSAVLDFSDVTYIDSTVISELIRLHNAREASGIERPTLVMRHPNLLRVLEILGLCEVFRIVGTLDDAVEKNGTDVDVHYVSSFADTIVA